MTLGMLDTIFNLGKAADTTLVFESQGSLFLRISTGMTVIFAISLVTIMTRHYLDRKWSVQVNAMEHKDCFQIIDNTRGKLQVSRYYTWKKGVTLNILQKSCKKEANDIYISFTRAALTMKDCWAL